MDLGKRNVATKHLFLTRGESVPTLMPQRTDCDVYRHFWLSQLGTVLYWHLVFKSQRCC